MKQPEVARATMGRLPVYLKYLREIESTADNISATTIAKDLKMGEVRVRKDLGSVSGAGRPKVGYNISELITTIEKYLSDSGRPSVVIVGAGKLGRALLDYGGFAEYGIDISAAFDIAVTHEEKSESGKQIFPASELAGFCETHNVRIGIITVPADAAQSVCDELVKCRVKGIWCFAPTTLEVPSGISVRYENMALSLAYLNKVIINQNS